MRCVDADKSDPFMMSEIAARSTFNDEKNSMSVRACKDALTHDSLGVYVVEHKGNIIGCAAIFPGDTFPDFKSPSKKAWLRNVYVSPEYRRKGIGTYLVGYVCYKAHELGCEDVLVKTSDERIARFFERTGVFHFVCSDTLDSKDGYILKGYCGGLPPTKKLKLI